MRDRLIFGLCVIAAMAARDGFAQPISFGLKGGVPFTDAVQGGAFKYFSWAPESRAYTVGPAVEIRFLRKLSLEIDLLYRPVGYSRYGSIFPNVFERTKTRADAWQFPAVVKYRLLSGATSPYVGAGSNFVRLFGAHSTDEAVVDGMGFVLPRSAVLQLRTTSNWGALASAGVETGVWKLRISPEIRFTRWSSDLFRDPVWDDSYRKTVKSNRNQIEFLVGIMLR